MNYAFIITAIFVLITALQLIILLKKKLYKEAVVSVVLMLIALIYCYNELYYWKLPSPSEIIGKTFEGLARLVFGNNIK